MKGRIETEEQYREALQRLVKILLEEKDRNICEMYHLMALIESYENDNCV